VIDGVNFYICQVVGQKEIFTNLDDAQLWVSNLFGFGFFLQSLFDNGQTF
jgi:hypothetical protein